MLKKIAELYRYRDLLRELVSTELKLRYRRSVLGFLWTMLNPFLMMVVLTAVFSTLMRFGVKDYAVLLLAGLLPWTFFSQSVTLSLMSLVSKGSLLRQVYVPKAMIPLAAVFSCLVNFLLALVPFLLLAAALGRPLNATLFFLPVPILLMTLFTCGVALIFSCLNVFFRDFTHMTEVLLSMWFYLSPVLYTLDLVPPAYRGYFQWNPMYYLLATFRQPIYEGTLPAFAIWATAAAAAVLMGLAGFAVFIRFERHFVLRV